MPNKMIDSGFCECGGQYQHVDEIENRDAGTVEDSYQCDKCETWCTVIWNRTTGETVAREYEEPEEDSTPYTKGPWVIEWVPFMGEYDSEGERNPDVAFIGPSGDGVAVAIVFPPEGENPHDSPTLKANANLIAAVTDLLEALEGLLDHAIGMYASGSSAIFAITKAEQAIVKAKGGVSDGQ